MAFVDEARGRRPLAKSIDKDIWNEVSISFLILLMEVVKFMSGRARIVVGRNSLELARGGLIKG
jgi:hypothetical protein